MKYLNDMYKHFLFTRWNKLDANTSIYNNPAVPDPEAWMDHRMKLFDEITLPSVMMQTSMDFQWLLSFDNKTPKWILSKYSEFPRVKIIFEYPADYLRRMKGYSIRDGEWIITSRLDNDDMILPEYIEKIQGYFNEQFMLVDTDGVQLDLATGKEYTVERRSQNSPFISLIEQVGVPWQSCTKELLIDQPVKTVYYCSHSKMEWHFPSVKIPQKLYKMVIHDRNITNKIIGKEIT